MMETTSNGSWTPAGYVRFENKVRISLNSSKSKAEVRELKRKLVFELDQVRSLKKKIEKITIDSNNNDNKKKKRVGSTLARVNSAVSCVGPADSKVEDRGGVIRGCGSNVGPGDSRVGGGRGNVEKKEKGGSVERVKGGMQKVSRVYRESEVGIGKGKVSNSVSDKKVKKGGGGGGGGKRDGGGEVAGFGVGNSDGDSKKLFRRCKDLLEKLIKHQYGWVFNAPVDVKKLKLKDYFKIIKHPMDLGTVKSRLTKHWYKSPKGFAEDVRLTFRNAMTYNEKGQDVHAMADVLLKIFEEKWASLKAEFNFDKKLVKGGDASSTTPVKKRPPGARAPNATNPPKPASLEGRTVDRSEPMTRPVDSSSKSTNIATNRVGTPEFKDPESKSPDKREMTYEEKQRLSTDLQSLPSDKLDGIVQIIRKRNPGLFQQEDEIEVDIESFDTDTLWELDRFVSNYKKSSSKKNATAEPDDGVTEDADHDISEHNLGSFVEEALEEPGAVENIGTPVQGEKHSDNVSRSSSSSSDSGSSSSDSESDSSSGEGSDVGQ